MKEIFLAAWMIVFSAHASANQGWFQAGKVTRLHSGHSAAIFLFSTEKQLSAGPDCGDNSHGYMVTNDAESGRKIYATLLLAYSMGKNVSIFLTGDCANGRPTVNAVQINDTDYF